MTDLELETWIVEAGGDVIEKASARGQEALTPLETLIYCLWVADYGMRNAGDLEAAADVHAGFQEEAARLAADLGLPLTRAALELPAADLEQRYFDLLAAIVGELDARRRATGR